MTTGRLRLPMPLWSLYQALPEWLEKGVDAVLHPFGIYGHSCRGREGHEHKTGRWLS